MPVAYVREYVQCQEHFSAANFLRAIAHSGDDRLAPRRWIVTTRTCNEISQLAFSGGMQRLLIAGAPQSALRVLSLSSIASRAQLDEALHRSRARQAGEAALVRHIVVLIVADRMSVTTSQVNLTMEAIASLHAVPEPGADAGVVGAPVVTYVLLQHVAPEQLGFQGCSDAIFLDGWEYLFCDAFGMRFVDTDASRERGGGGGGREDVVVEARVVPEASSFVLDSRLWLAAAYGLEAPLSLESITTEFSPSFMTEALLAFQSAQVQVGLWRTWPMQAGERARVARRVFDAHPFVLSWALRRAAARWAGIMSNVVSDATAKIIAGETVMSLLGITSHALTAVLGGYARLLARTALSEYNFEALIQLLDGGDAGAARRQAEAPLWAACLELYPEPSMTTLETIAELVSVRAYFTSKYVPRVPFIANLFTAIGAARTRIAAAGALSDDDMIASITALLRSGDGVAARAAGAALDAIAELPGRWRDIVADYAGLGLSLLDVQGLEFEVVVELLMLCVEERNPVALVVRGAGIHLGDTLDAMLPLRHLRAADCADATAAAHALLIAGGLVSGGGGAGGAGDSAAVLLEALRGGVLARVLAAFSAGVAAGALGDDVAGAVRDVCVKFATAQAAASRVPREQREAFLWMWFVRAALLNLRGAGAAQAAVLAGAPRPRAEAGRDAFASLAGYFVALTDALPRGGVTGDADLAFDICQFVLADGAVDSAVARQFVRDAAMVQRGDAPRETVTQVLVGALSPRMRLLFLRTLVCTRGPVSAGACDEINLVVPEIVEYRPLTCGDFLPAARAAHAAVEATFAAGARGIGVAVGGGGGGADPAGAVAATPMELLYAAVDHWVRQLAEAGEDGAAWLRERLPRAAALPAVELMTLTSFCVAHVRARAAAYAANPDAATATAADAAMMRAVMSCAPEMAAVLLGAPEMSSAAAIALCSTPAHGDAMALPEAWRVPAVASATHLELSYSRLPFVLGINLIEGSAAWTAAYASAAQLLNGGRDDFTAWFRRVGDVFIARGTFFLALFHCVFEELRPCPAWVRAVVAGALLDLTADERKAFMVLVNPPSAAAAGINADAGVEYFFSAASFASGHRSDAVRRAQFAAVMAYLLGVPREKNYARMCCFETANMPQSFGLGSDFSGYSKDCGYQLLFAANRYSFADISVAPLPPPFANVKRYRACNNYLIWASLAWGIWLRSEAHREEYMYTTTIRDHTCVLLRNKRAPWHTCSLLRACSSLIVRDCMFLHVLACNQWWVVRCAPGTSVAGAMRS
jgi:hypothetical protein